MVLRDRTTSHPKERCHALIGYTLILLSVFRVLSVTASPNSPTDARARTFHQANGNRTLAGSSQIDQFAPIDIPLDHRPFWLVSAPFEDGALWVAVSKQGEVEGFKTAANRWEPISLSPQLLPIGMPPSLRILNDRPELLVPPEDASRFTEPVLTSPSQDFVYLDASGSLVIQQSSQTFELPIKALLDARIVTDEGDRLAVLTDPTSEYAHNVLGDSIEAKSITLVATRPQPTIINRIEIPDPWVIEGIAPIWTDLNNEGSRELILTLSSHTDGGKIVVYNETGRLVAEGPGIGRGFRWRNQMAVANYGPNGERELTAIKTPHIGGTLEYYRWVEDRLEIAASLFGFTSHVIQSRNLDLSITGDFTGTGQPVIVVPTNQRDSLQGLRRIMGGVERVFSLPLGDRLASNPAAVTLPNGQLGLGIGLQTNRLRLWLPSDPIVKLSLPKRQSSGALEITLHAPASTAYQLEFSSNLVDWRTTQVGIVPPGQSKTQISLSDEGAEHRFYRVVEPSLLPAADVRSVTVSGEEGRYTFSVQIASDETGCDQYADWWEVLSESGELLHRRILLHSHVNEQPFTRSGGPVLVPPDQTVIVRAHLHPVGYVGTAMKGSVQDGFEPTNLPASFAAGAARLPPFSQTGDCPF